MQKKRIGGHTKAMTRHEKEILREIKGLPEAAQEKLAKVVHFFKAEVISDRPDEKLATEEMLSVCGQWEDDRTVDQQLEEIYSSRKSTSRAEGAF